MSRCDPFAPLLSRVAEGEASPDEAMRAASHLSYCTACRITLARERRLAAILDDSLEDPLQVGEDFLQAVMDNLPAEPPRPPRRRKKRRTLKLACLIGLLGLAPLLGTIGSGATASGPMAWSLTPVIREPLGYSTIEAVQRLGGLLLFAMNDLTAVPHMLGEALPSAAVLALVLVPMAGCLALGAGLLALATGGLLTSRVPVPVFASRGRQA